MSEPSYIAEELQVVGAIEGDEDLFVAGSLDGDVVLDARLVVEATGIVRGDVTATQVVVRGQLSGNVRASEMIRVEADAQLLGDLAAPRVVVAPGARFRGKVSQRLAPRPSLALEPQAPRAVELAVAALALPPEAAQQVAVEPEDAVLVPSTASAPFAASTDAADTVAGVLPAALRPEPMAVPALRIALPRRVAARRRVGGGLA